MKIVVGFSGGVDSAVTTRLLQKAGHEVHGLYMDNTDEKALWEAQVSAERMGIELTVIDVKSELEEKVCRPFTESYLRGETPNPCILCNPSVKFRQLIALADRIGAEKVATGHYARAENGALYKGMPANDQSYMLCRLTREQVSRLVLPLGVYEKTQVRAMAAEWGLDAAHKPDSMEICFIPDKNYIRWMSERAELPGPGDFVFHDKVIGTIRIRIKIHDNKIPEHTKRIVIIIPVKSCNEIRKDGFISRFKRISSRIKHMQIDSFFNRNKRFSC